MHRQGFTAKSSATQSRPASQPVSTKRTRDRFDETISRPNVEVSTKRSVDETSFDEPVASGKFTLPTRLCPRSKHRHSYIIPNPGPTPRLRSHHESPMVSKRLVLSRRLLGYFFLPRSLAICVLDRKVDARALFVNSVFTLRADTVFIRISSVFDKTTQAG